MPFRTKPPRLDCQASVRGLGMKTALVVAAGALNISMTRIVLHADSVGLALHKYTYFTK